MGSSSRRVPNAELKACNHKVYFVELENNKVQVSVFCLLLCIISLTPMKEIKPDLSFYNDQILTLAQSPGFNPG